MRILLAVDDSKYSQCAAETVRRRPWPPGSIVRVFSAFQPALPVDPLAWTVDTLGLSSYEEEARKHATGTVDRAAEIVRQSQSGLVVETRVESGDPRVVILDEAERWKADLIVAGSHGLGGVRRLLLGSVAQHVATHAPCSVEIVRDRRA